MNDTQAQQPAGLSGQEVQQRLAQGKFNADVGVKTKTEKQIILEHIFTFFNLINLCLAVLLVLVGSYRNLMFMGVVLCNVCIGTFQEIRSKRTIDRLSLLSAPKALVIRDGQQQEIGIHDVVLDDLLCLASGNQICADCLVLSGECEVNESLLTGESDPVTKKEGDALLSGSFLVSGSCRAAVTQVGAENYSNQIAADAKYLKKPNSEILYWTKKIIWFFGLCIIPIGLTLFLKHYCLSGETLAHSVTSMAASMIGMIPEGLVLLTSVVFAVSVFRLSKAHTLVQEMYCIETLARVDTLCLDKTGTITEGTMQVDELVPLDDNPKQEIENQLCTLCSVLQDNNPTINAIRAVYAGKTGSAVWSADDTHPFSSARKWSGIHLTDGTSLILGAGEFILGDDFAPLQQQAQKYTQTGQRVLLFAVSDGPFCENGLPQVVIPRAFVVLSDKIRKSAPKTLAFFREQGVDCKVISGDDPITAASIVKRAGMQGSESCIDMSTLHTQQEIDEAADKYSVFGRVTPQQKLQLIKALKAAGHTVAMTGDGVNDVLALKEADCSIAMASGSDAARTVSNLVLLDSDFASLPKVVAEGRRTVNNLQRSASLFTVKNMFTMIISLLFIFIPLNYPFQPIQFTLISSFTIGIPSFFLALEPNRERISGKFIVNVVKKSLPASVAMVLNIIIVCCIGFAAGFSEETISTLCVYSTALCSLCMLVRVSLPFNFIRGLLVFVVTAGFVCCSAFLRSFFMLMPMNEILVAAFIPSILFTSFCFPALSHITDTTLTRKFDAIEQKMDAHKHRLTNRLQQKRAQKAQPTR